MKALYSFVELFTNSRRGFLKSTILGAGIGLELPAHKAAALPPATAPGHSAYTRGIGVYPGDPREDFAPEIVPADPAAYRNLALLRPAYHSSSYDYNLTAQLVTDGIKDTRLPRWVVTSEGIRGILRNNERELILDHNPITGIEVGGQQPWVQVQFCGGDGPPEIDRVEVLAAAKGHVDPADSQFRCLCLQQWPRIGKKWEASEGLLQRP